MKLKNTGKAPKRMESFASGTMSFTFENPHGTIEDGATYNEIIDIQLVLYVAMLR